MRKSIKGAVVAGVTAGALALGGGLAYAYVVISGDGQMTQTTVSSADYGLTVKVEDVTGLRPGTELPVKVAVRNNGPSKVMINTVKLTLSGDIVNIADRSVYNTISVTPPPIANGLLASGEWRTFEGKIAIADSDTVDQTVLLGKTFTLTAKVN